MSRHQVDTSTVETSGTFLFVSPSIHLGFKSPEQRLTIQTCSHEEQPATDVCYFIK